jgi:hypothetical protein
MDYLQSLKDRAYAAFGPVDVPISNAGTSPGGGPTDVPLAVGWLA